jgi:thiosulfate dehydrogenase
MPTLRIACTALLVAVAAAMGAGRATSQETAPPTPAKATPWTPPDIGALPDDATGRRVRLGRDIFTATYAHIGPNVPDAGKRYAGNNLACRNCHLHAGTEPYGFPVYGIAPDFPAYSARTGTEITLLDRLNSCMRRSMNGRPMPPDSPEMQALVAYIDFLSTGVPDSVKLRGYGAGRMALLDRAADPGRGKPVYEAKCVACHGENGQGVRRSLPSVDLGYMVPPLWGPDSFNDGAGMNRLITAANFLHSNMPHGTDYLHPTLAVEEAWDVAAYMLDQKRPSMAGLDKDFPDRSTKPFDTPYGPWADDLPPARHRFGPFPPR